MTERIMNESVRSSPLATRPEAQAYLRLSRNSFDRNVRPHLTVIEIGGRIFFEWEELEQWLENRKVAAAARPTASGRTHGTGRSSSDSGTRASNTNSPRARQILRRLRSARPDSTQK